MATLIKVKVCECDHQSEGVFIRNIPPETTISMLCAQEHEKVNPADYQVFVQCYQNENSLVEPDVTCSIGDLVEEFGYKSFLISCVSLEDDNDEPTSQIELYNRGKERMCSMANAFSVMMEQRLVDASYIKKKINR